VADRSRRCRRWIYPASATTLTRAPARRDCDRDQVTHEPEYDVTDLVSAVAATIDYEDWTTTDDGEP
jgi:hypothetical protein